MPADEADRLAELLSFRVLDTEREAFYDNLVALATQLCGTPLGAISFIDSERQWYKASNGFDVGETARDIAFCAHTIAEPSAMLEVSDAQADPRFVPHMLGLGPAPLRFYAGFALPSRKGSAVGALCVMDVVPRTLTVPQREGMVRLAQLAATQLGNRRDVHMAHLTDRLTGLSNWFHLEEQFDQVKASHGVIALVCLETVDKVTSAHGFRVADEVIRQAAERLRICGAFSSCSFPTRILQISRGRRCRS
jgi:diguanylate cyclase